MADTPTTFAANPLIQAIGSHLGLDPILNQATARPGASKPNVAESRDLPSAQLRLMRLMQAGMGSRRQGQMEPGGETPMLNPATLQDPHVQEMLKGYGVDPNVQVDPHLFIHDPAAWQNHPALSGLLENALTGAAFTNGAQTWGEGISNVARGLMDAQSARAEHVNAQLMMPFQQADAVAHLRQMQDSEAERQAQIQETKDRAEYWRGIVNAKGENSNPMYDLMNQILDARRKEWGLTHFGDTNMPADQLMDTFQQMQGFMHPRATPRPPSALEQWAQALTGKVKDNLIRNYGAPTDPNQPWYANVPANVLEDNMTRLQGDLHPVRPRQGPQAADPELRNSLIQQAEAKIQDIESRLVTSDVNKGTYMLKKPGQMAGPMINAADLAAMKNKIVDDLNVKLSQKRLPTLRIRYTEQGTRPLPKGAVAPSAPPQQQVQAPVQIPTPIAPARPSMQGTTNKVPTYNPATGQLEY